MLDKSMSGAKPVSGRPLPDMLENFLQTALEQAEHAVLCLETSSGRVLHVNRWAEKLTGLSMGHHFTPLSSVNAIGAPRLGWLDQVILEAIQEKFGRTFVVPVMPGHDRGKRKALDVTASRISSDGKDMVVVIIREAADGGKIERSLRKRNHELHLLNRASWMVGRSLDPDKVARLAIDASVDLLNVNTGKVFTVDWEKALLIQISEKNVSRPGAAGTTNVVEHRMALQAIRNEAPVIATNIFGGASAEMRGAPAAIASIPLKSTGQVLGVLQVTGDKNLFLKKDSSLLDSLGFQVGIALENAMLHQQVKQTADVDKLTGVLTRQRVEKALANRVKSGERYRETFAVLMIDIDRFKSFNDVHGHEVGDQVLRSVAQVLLEEVRETDRLGRWGGEEFLVILPGADAAQAVVAAERIRMRIAAQCLALEADAEIPVTVSIGASCYPEHSNCAEGMVKAADEAMLWVKRSGRNSTRIFSANMENACPLPPRNKLFQGVGLSTIHALAAALDAKDDYTANHSQDVKDLALKIAQTMMINRERLETLEIAALLHDIGKVSVPDTILNKPGPLNAKEWEILKEHPRMGVMILREAPQLSPILPVVLHHHENFDGSGYPEGRRGRSIPVLARILAVADAFMAMTTSRPYRKAMDPVTALKEIAKSGGQRYDPRMVDALKAVLANESRSSLASGMERLPTA